ncbi:serine/threonine-protein kinase pim-2-like [Mya arenaria]|uniref:serine/threonine-protein kinase pim-2-like n=1 Tax=Mya arenaria TaxID=6604 RepID=UPI0022E8E158|nr:serine/threonine-protein kinase pim-2-like [Mya arenaria]
MKALKQNISIQNYIDKGSTGKVYQARRRKDGKSVVVKFATWLKSKNRVPPEIFNSLRLRKCGVQGVNKILGYEIQREHSPECVGRYYAVFEKHPMDIFTYVEKYAPPEPVVRDIVRSTITHLCEMDKKAGMMHMDIKPENTLIDPDTIGVTLCDVEFCVKTGEEFIPMKESEGGTIAFMAPERFLGLCFPRKTSVWSIGIMTYAMLHANDVPFEKYIGNISLPIRFDSSVSTQASDFILMCLQPNPRKRPTADELLDCEWMKS